jgi:hypothetical protein
MFIVLLCGLFSQGVIVSEAAPLLRGGVEGPYPCRD